MKVLIADDEKITREGLRDIIDWNKLGAELVYLAKNGQDALQFITNNEVDVLITDIKMPKLDGLGLIKNIVNQNLDISIIILSGYSDFTYAQKAIQYGAIDYLLKPVVIEDLEKILFSIKEKRSSNRDRIHIDEEEQKKYDKQIKNECHALRENLIKSIASLNINEANNILKEIYNLHLNNNFSLSMFKKTSLRLINKIVNAMETKTGLELVYFTDTDRLMSIIIAKEYDDVYKIIYDFTNDLYNHLYKMNDENNGHLINRLKAKIDSDFADKEFSLNNIANEFDMTPNYLGTQFKIKTGVSFSEYVERLRIEKACKLLKETNLKIYEIADRCGYSDGQYLARVFKNVVGKTPLEYKNSHK